MPPTPSPRSSPTPRRAPCDAARPDADDCAQWLAACAPDAVTWEGWQAIDEHERAAGEPHGRPRVKLVRLADLVAAGRGVRS